MSSIWAHCSTYISPMPFLRSSSLISYILSLQLGPTRGSSCPAFTSPLTDHPLPYLVPLVLFLLLASGIHLPMSVIFDAFKCMGFFPPMFISKTGFASYYLNKHKRSGSALFKCSLRALKSWNCHRVSASEPLHPLIDEMTVLEEVNSKRPPGMHCGP